jgi:hypothetical protein
LNARWTHRKDTLPETRDETLVFAAYNHKRPVATVHIGDAVECIGRHMS